MLSRAGSTYCHRVPVFLSPSLALQREQDLCYKHSHFPVFFLFTSCRLPLPPPPNPSPHFWPKPFVISLPLKLTLCLWFLALSLGTKALFLKSDSVPTTGSQQQACLEELLPEGCSNLWMQEYQMIFKTFLSGSFPGRLFLKHELLFIFVFFLECKNIAYCFLTPKKVWGKWGARKSWNCGIILKLLFSWVLSCRFLSLGNTTQPDSTSCRSQTQQAWKW